jgi:acyl-CoA hydrolase
LIEVGFLASSIQNNRRPGRFGPFKTVSGSLTQPTWPDFGLASKSVSHCRIPNRNNRVKQTMESFKLVMPENLNHFGFLFGGYMLMWVDEIAWIAATMEFPGLKFVTIAMDRVEFRHGVREGTILRFVTKMTRTGNTSADFLVEVHGASAKSQNEPIFSTTVTLVNVDENGRKKQI